ncbi:MAG: CRISPR-associated endonuclease Cas2 [Phycisphaeraceae bacterium]|nr:CRISPR-associated endonuclease Cas2 [Phycisphaeraceae bacterium]
MARRAVASEYQAMWVLALFDLPVTGVKERREYAQFRKELIKRGFWMMQYSVYARYCRSEDSADVVRQQIRAVLPPEGQVRVLAVTERQFGKMQTYVGKKRQEAEKAPQQFVLF